MNEMDTQWFKKAKHFFTSPQNFGVTFDDVSLATLYSDILPAETNLETKLSEELSLNIPIISSDMDTITESEMAIQMALLGGMGIIHYNMPEREQIKEVARVKNNVHGLIQDPIKVYPDWLIGDVLELLDKKNYQFRSFPVVDNNNKLLGLLSGRVVKERYRNKTVSKAMTPRSQVFTILESNLGNDPIESADQFFNQHLGINKLLVVNQEDCLKGLFTLSDIEQIMQEHKAHFKPARDSDFRLRCAAAISVIRKKDGSIDSKRILDQVGNLSNEGVDAIAISTAHGFSKGVGETVALIRSSFRELNLIAGNVTSADGVSFLAEAGANAIKVGQGPGSICTTRQVAGVGIPQLTALYASSIAAKNKGVRIIADGGLAKSGDLVKALTLADCTLCGSLLAGCREAPGAIIEIEGKSYKQYRGMGSLAAMSAGSAARYGHNANNKNRKVAAEGIEALKEISGSVDEVIRNLCAGIQAGMGYLGASDLQELKEKAHYIRVSPASQKESAPHDVIQIKSND